MIAEIIAIALGLGVGLSLGALGGGGSTLAVPILVFVAGLSVQDATTASLLVVGTAAAIGVVGHYRNGNVRLGTGIAFGLAGTVGSRVGTLLNRSLSEQLLLLAFSVLIVFVSIRMYRSAGSTDKRAAGAAAGEAVEGATEARPGSVDEGGTVAVATTTRTGIDLSAPALAKLAGAATAVGLLTGLFGVGGGFAVVPALTLLLGFGAKEAIGTSLVVIAINATIALGMRSGDLDFDWAVVLPFLVTVTVGVLIGTRIARQIDADEAHSELRGDARRRRRLHRSEHLDHLTTTPRPQPPIPSQEHLMSTISIPDTDTISTAELRRLISDDPNVRILDVRSGGEFDALHIPGSYNVPLDTLREHASDLADVEHAVVLVCKSGARASQAHANLTGAGKQRLHLLDGGIDAWESAGGDVVHGNTQKWALDRQVRLVAGSISLAALLASVVPRRPSGLAGGVAAGPHLLRGLQHLCDGQHAAELPYNRPTTATSTACSTTCGPNVTWLPPNHPASDYTAVVDSTTQFIDVRQPEEVATGSLPGAINIPLDQLPGRIGELDPQRRVVLLCRSGNRSGQRRRLPRDVGFVDVVNLDGGMLALDPSRRELIMKFTQYYLDCLSQASYLIGDETTGRAVVVDPRRDIDEYVDDAEAAGLSIELIIETHFHADFLSGHLELAAATGAEIAYSDVAETEFESRKLAHGERIELGDVVLEIRHTPGHTPESISIVVWEHRDDDAPYGVLTGDTLFIGDVGRPDLLASIGFTREELADKLYDSLHDQLLTLPDATRSIRRTARARPAARTCRPTPGRRSASSARRTTPCWPHDKQAFFDLVTEGQPPAPEYFVYDAVLNRKDRELLDETDEPTALTTRAVRRARRRRSIHPRRSRPGGVRPRTPHRLDQRRAQRPLRRVRRVGDPARRRHRPRRRRRLRTRSEEPAGSHRLRPSGRIPPHRRRS